MEVLYNILYMKKITFFSSLILLGFIFGPLLAKADILPSNSHGLDLCAKVTNLDSFPGVNLIGEITDLLGTYPDNKEITQIRNNECIHKGYKFNSINIYWNTENNKNFIDKNNLLIKNMDVYGGYVNDNDPLIKKTVEYNLVKSDSGKYSLEKSRTISEYNNGKSPKIETFSIEKVKKAIDDAKNFVEDGVKDVGKIQKRGFWNSVLCFFGLNRYCD